MCGIAAIYAYRSSAERVNDSELEAITISMTSRGPDAGATWVSSDGRAGLGSRRLAIIDPSPAGTQPMWDRERELAIVFNGEIYNHRELRDGLEQGGVSFRSHTDTEVLLELYRRDGDRMVGLLRGMFAFAVWDSRSSAMFVARDPYGIKPLYASDDGGTIRLASEVKALLAGGRVSREVDPAGAAGFFLTGSVPEPFTIRRSIRAIEPGTSFFIGNSGPERRRNYYSISQVFRAAEEQEHYARLVDPSVLLRERIRDSVDYHLVSDVPVGIFLSSGIDSSSIAAMAASLSRGTLRTFTLAFEEFRKSPADEAPLAERFAQQLGTDHTTRVVTRSEFESDLPRFLAAMDQPTIDGLNTWFVSKAVHEAGVKVALSGIGGDELLGSYPSFRNVPAMVSLSRFPLAASIASLAARHPKGHLIPSYGRTWAGAYLLQRGLYLPADLPSLLGKEVAREGLERLQLLELIDASLTPDPATDFGRVATLEASMYMRNQLLRDADWASMAHSVEVRTPLVDSALLRQIAPVLLERGRDSKSALAADLPLWLRGRKKRGFFVPLAQWAGLPPDGTTTRMRTWARTVFESVTS